MRALCALLFCDVTKDSLLSYYTHTLTIFKTDMRQIMKELVVTIDEDLDVRRNILFFPFFSLLLVSSFLTFDISSQCHVALFILKTTTFRPRKNKNSRKNGTCSPSPRKTKRPEDDNSGCACKRILGKSRGKIWGRIF